MQLVQDQHDISLPVGGGAASRNLISFHTFPPSSLTLYYISSRASSRRVARRYAVMPFLQLNPLDNIIRKYSRVPQAKGNG